MPSNWWIVKSIKIHQHSQTGSRRGPQRVQPPEQILLRGERRRTHTGRRICSLSLIHGRLNKSVRLPGFLEIPTRAWSLTVRAKSFTVNLTGSDEIGVIESEHSSTHCQMALARRACRLMR